MFLHPVISQQPPVIWLASDDVRVGEKKVRELEEQLDTYGLVVSDEGDTGRDASARRRGSRDEGRDSFFRNMHIVMYGK
jgi:hypothetical protein